MVSLQGQDAKLSSLANVLPSLDTKLPSPDAELLSHGEQRDKAVISASSTGLLISVVYYVVPSLYCVIGEWNVLGFGIKQFCSG